MKKIAIFGAPRSGTSWLGHIINSHPDVVLRFQPLFSYGHKGRLSEQSSAEEIRAFFGEILDSHDAFATMKADMQANYPTFKKSGRPTHIAFKETRYLHTIENILARCHEIRIIGMVRNPLAVLSSWISAPKEFDPEWNIEGEWRAAPSKNQNRPEECFGFDKWKWAAETFLRFQSQFPEQFSLVRYDELNKAPLDITRVVFDFCGLKLCEQVEDFISASKSRHDSDPYSVFRSEAGDGRWREMLPGEIARQIVAELKDSPLKIFIDDRATV